MRRKTDVASSTLLKDCFHLKTLYRWAQEKEIDLERRMLDGQYLTLGELVSLEDACAEQLSEIHQGPRRKTAKNIQRFGSDVSRRHRKARIRQIALYLYWLGMEGLPKANSELTRSLRSKELDRMTAALQKAGKDKASRKTINLREAPEPDVVQRLLKVIDVESPENPWAPPPNLEKKLQEAKERGKDVLVHRIESRLRKLLALRIRNELLVWLILACSLRRGEVMGLRVNDIDALSNQLFIVRRPDDPMDLRTFEPNVKGNDGISQVKDSLIRMAFFYINVVREKIPGAKKHTVLFVHHQNGRGLSLGAANKVFTVLRRKVPDLPEDLTPHLLRHAANDEYSQLCDLMKVDHERERRNRELLNRWNWNSKMDHVYDRRHERKIADQFSLKQQDRIWKRVKGEDPDAPVA
jgi:integrase